MNNSYNCTDFIGLSLDSNDDYEPYGYGYGGESLQTVEFTQTSVAERGIESVIFANAADRYGFD